MAGPGVLVEVTHVQRNKAELKLCVPDYYSDLSPTGRLHANSCRFNGYFTDCLLKELTEGDQLYCSLQTFSPLFDKIPWRAVDAEFTYQVPRSDEMLGILNKPRDASHSSRAYIISPFLDKEKVQLQGGAESQAVVFATKFQEMNMFENTAPGDFVRFKVAYSNTQPWPMTMWAIRLTDQEVEALVRPTAEMATLEKAIDDFVTGWRLLMANEEIQDKMENWKNRTEHVQLFFHNYMSFPVDVCFQIDHQNAVNQLLRVKPGDELLFQRPNGSGFHGFVRHVDYAEVPPTVFVTFDDARAAALLESREPERARDQLYTVHKTWNSSPYTMTQDFLVKILPGLISSPDPTISHIFQLLIGYQKEYQGISKIAQGEEFTIQAPGLPPMTTIPHQQVTKAILDDNRPVTLVEGPPGCGKSTHLACLIHNILEAEGGGDAQILVCTPSNRAADHIGHLLMELSRSEQSNVRPARMFPDERIFRADTECREIAPLFMVYAKNHLDNNEIIQERAELVELRNQLQKLDFQEPHRKDDIKQMRELFEDIKGREQDLKDQIITLMNPNVVVSTCFMAAPLSRDEGWRFTHVIIDEVGQATLPLVLMASQSLSQDGRGQVVLVGDRHQLPPTIISCGLAGAVLEESVLADLEDRGRSPIFKMQTTYRMHPSILAFPAREIYENRLDTPITPGDRRKMHLKFPFPQKDIPMVFLATFGKEELNSGKSYTNDEEARVVARLVRYLVRQAGCSLSDIGVLSFYDAQRAKLILDLDKELNPRERVYNITDHEVANVDSFQGQERNIIILTCTRSVEAHNSELNRNTDPGKLGFLTDYRRGNVAITRPREALFIVGNPFTLTGHWFWRNLVSHWGSLGLIRPNYIEVMDQVTIKRLPGLYTAEGQLQNLPLAIFPDGVSQMEESEGEMDHSNHLAYNQEEPRRIQEDEGAAGSSGPSSWYQQLPGERHDHWDQ